VQLRSNAYFTGPPLSAAGSLRPFPADKELISSNIKRGSVGAGEAVIVFCGPQNSSRTNAVRHRRLFILFSSFRSGLLQRRNQGLGFVRHGYAFALENLLCTDFLAVEILVGVTIDAKRHA
jgi:hypothetical protein